MSDLSREVVEEGLVLSVVEDIGYLVQPDEPLRGIDKTKPNSLLDAPS